MKTCTEPGGRDYIQNIINSVPYFDEAFKNDDLPALASRYHAVAESYTKLAPFITRPKLQVAITNVAKATEMMSKFLTRNGGSLEDSNELAKYAGTQILSALE